MPGSPVSISPFHILVNASGLRFSNPVTSRRRDAQAGSIARPRWPVCSRVTRWRTSVSMSLPRADQVIPVGHDHRIRKPEADRFGIRRGQVDRHVRDLVTPRLRLGVQPPDHRGAGPALDVGQQPRCAHRVDDPGVPPVVGDPPPPGHRVLGPDRFPAAGLIDAEDLHHGQRFGQRAGDVTSQRRVGDRPGHPVVDSCCEHAAEPVRGRGTRPPRATDTSSAPGPGPARSTR